MIQEFAACHDMDDRGNPAGGCSRAPGIDIEWQNGPLGENEPNGAFVETVIAIAIDRLRFYQNSKFTCRQNALAITRLEEALHWLFDRTLERQKRGVEGTHTP